MNIIKAENYEQISRIAANIVAGQINSKPNSLLGLATGSSPVGLYTELIKMYNAGDVDFTKVRSVNLDEYVGIDPTAVQSYNQFMRDNLFDSINMKEENHKLPNGKAEDLEAECVRYDELIRSQGGIDLQILGLGHNGHIGFNEPSEHFSYGTNVVELNDMTIDANTRFFDCREDVPTKAITMGIFDIMNAKSILMVVSGADKKEILKTFTTGVVTPKVPASILRFHPNCTIIADKAALGE